MDLSYNSVRSPLISNSNSGAGLCLAILSISVERASTLPFNILFSYFIVSFSFLNICSNSEGLVQGAGLGGDELILFSKCLTRSSFWSMTLAIAIISFLNLSISMLWSVIFLLRWVTSSESSWIGATTIYLSEGFLRGEEAGSLDLALLSASLTGVFCLRVISLLIKFEIWLTNISMSGLSTSWFWISEMVDPFWDCKSFKTLTFKLWKQLAYLSTASN